MPAIIALCFAGTLSAQQPPEQDPRIKQIVTEISSKHLASNIERLVGFGTRNTLSDTLSDSLGIGAARRWIRSEFERYATASDGRMSVETQSFIAPISARIPRPTTIVNVIATLHPRKNNPQPSAPILIVSGHYDSRATNVLDSAGAAPGANDDGSGTALVMELARVLSKYDVNSSIKFVAFAGEEQGLVGSTHLAETAAAEHWNIAGVFNNDIVGNSHGGDNEYENRYVRLFSAAYGAADTGSFLRVRNALGLENDGASRSLARYIKDVSERYVPNFKVRIIYRGDRFLRGGDHLPFHDRGFAAVRFTEARENFERQHRDIVPGQDSFSGDLTGYMDFAYCTNIACMNAAAVASLAFAPPAPQGVEIVTTKLAYTTTLQWRSNADRDQAGFYVRYRDTTSPEWQAKLFTQDTTITLKISKDDYLFGIQSVNKRGNVSLTVSPRPSH